MSEKSAKAARRGIGLVGPDGIPLEPEVNPMEIHAAKENAVVTGMFFSAIGAARSLGYPDDQIDVMIAAAKEHSSSIDDDVIREQIATSKKAAMAKSS